MAPLGDHAVSIFPPQPLPADLLADAGQDIAASEPTEAEQALLGAAAGLIEAAANAQLALQEARKQLVTETEPEIVKLAIAIAERVVGRELATDPKVIALWAKEGVASLVSEDIVEVRVSADLADQLDGLREALADERVSAVLLSEQLVGTQIEVVGRYGRVDANLKARLDAVIEALGTEELP